MEDLATSPTNRSWRSRLSPRTFTLETVAKIVAFLFIPFLGESWTKRVANGFPFQAAAGARN